jgi:hypothetical protein
VQGLKILRRVLDKVLSPAPSAKFLQHQCLADYIKPLIQADGVTPQHNPFHASPAL